MAAILAVPLLAQGGELFGSLWVLYREPRTFARADTELLSAFGTQASVALENAGAFDRLAQQAMHDAALQEFGRRLLEATTETDVLDDAVGTAQRLLQADTVDLFLADTGSRPRLAATVGWQPDAAGTDIASVQSFAEHALVRKETHLEKHGVRSVITVRLGAEDHPVGALVTCNRMPRGFTSEDKRVLTSLAHQIAVALDKVRLYAELRNNLQRLQETQAQLMQADKLTALGTLLSGVAHELSNPLAAISLSAEFLRRARALDATLIPRVDVIDAACSRASRIIRDLLVFARRQPSERRRADLNEIIELTLNLQAPQLDLNKIRVITALEPAPAVWVDSHQLQQVFLNLFSNAIHAMKTARGHGILTVRTLWREPEVVVQVEDDGPGIPAEHLGRIFDPFFTTKAVGEGTGLGLSLAIGIIEAHGGHMHVENVPGAGARFTISLRAAEGEEVEPRRAPAPSVPAMAAAADVLVVEDDDWIRGLLTEVFNALGYQVVEATTGEAALARLQQDRDYDVIMLDLRLPGVDGQTVWRALASNPQMAARVIFVTGDIMSAETQSFLEETGRPFLIKPFTMEQVGRVVSEVLAAAS